MVYNQTNCFEDDFMNKINCTIFIEDLISNKLFLNNISNVIIQHDNIDLMKLNMNNLILPNKALINFILNIKHNNKYFNSLQTNLLMRLDQNENDEYFEDYYVINNIWTSNKIYNLELSNFIMIKYLYYISQENNIIFFDYIIKNIHEFIQSINEITNNSCEQYKYVNYSNYNMNFHDLYDIVPSLNHENSYIKKISNHFSEKFHYPMIIVNDNIIEVVSMMQDYMKLTNEYILTLIITRNNSIYSLTIIQDPLHNFEFIINDGNMIYTNNIYHYMIKNKRNLYCNDLKIIKFKKRYIPLIYNGQKYNLGDKVIDDFILYHTTIEKFNSLLSIWIHDVDYLIDNNINTCSIDDFCNGNKCEKLITYLHNINLNTEKIIMNLNDESFYNIFDNYLNLMKKFNSTYCKHKIKNLFYKLLLNNYYTIDFYNNLKILIKHINNKYRKDIEFDMNAGINNLFYTHNFNIFHHNIKKLSKLLYVDKIQTINNIKIIKNNNINFPIYESIYAGKIVIKDKVNNNIGIINKFLIDKYKINNIDIIMELNKTLKMKMKKFYDFNKYNNNRLRIHFYFYNIFKELNDEELIKISKIFQLYNMENENCIYKNIIEYKNIIMTSFKEFKEKLKINNIELALYEIYEDLCNSNIII